MIVLLMLFPLIHDYIAIESGVFFPNIIIIVNGHRKQQLSYTENQQTLFLFPIFIDARLTYDQKIRMSSQSTTSYAILKCLSSGGPLPPVRNRATPSP